MVDLSNSEWKSVVYVNTAYQDNLYLGSKNEQRSKSRSMLNLVMVDKFPSVTVPSVTNDLLHKLKLWWKNTLRQGQIASKLKNWNVSLVNFVSLRVL